MIQRRNQTSAQSGIYRVTVPVPHEHRQNLRTLAHEAGARSFSDLVLILVQRPEEAGKILAPLVLEIAGTHWKEQALEKIKAAAAKEGLSLSDLHKALFGEGSVGVHQESVNSEHDSTASSSNPDGRPNLPLTPPGSTPARASASALRWSA